MTKKPLSKLGRGQRGEIGDRARRRGISPVSEG